MKKIKVWFYHGDLEDQGYNEFHEGNIGLLNESDSFSEPYLYGPNDEVYLFRDTAITMGFRPEHDRHF